MRGSPGTDSRIVLATGVVKGTSIDETGYYANVELVGVARPWKQRCRIAPPHPGVHVPVEDGSEVVVAIPMGDPRQGPVVVGPLLSRLSPPSSNAQANPGDVWVEVPNKQVHVTAAKVVVTCDDIRHGSDSLTALQGTMNGTAVDPFTGATHAALGNASTKVRNQE